MTIKRTVPAWPRDRPELLAFAPIICVAWSDGVLTPDEFGTLARLLERQAWVEEQDRSLIHTWLDPQLPPSPEGLNALRSLIREFWPEDRPLLPTTLAGLGLELVRASGLTAGPWSNDEAPGQLSEAEAALGISGSEAVRVLLGAKWREAAPAARPVFDPEIMYTFLESTHRDLRARVLHLLATPALQIPIEADRATQRELVLNAVKTLAQEGLSTLAYPEAYGGVHDPEAAMAVFETLAFGDLSIPIKFGVQFGLFGGSVLQLGTRRHHDAYLDRIGRLDLPGCYAMTELGHGSNVRDVETTATYLPETKEFEIHTPTESATKDWIGNAGLHGRMATVFAQLTVDGAAHGVHAFLVPIRSEDGAALAGVSLKDRGPKEGLNGVDNGQISFAHVRVPWENLLDRFGQVTEEGRYTSPIPSPGRRFFTMLGTLVGGRIGIGAASNSVSKTAITIAVRRASRRRQFGRGGAQEVPILDYLHVQRELLPRLAKTYALHFATRGLQKRLGADEEGDTREIEVMAAGLKAESSWHAIETTQACREVCGGEGYDAENRFGRLKADVDVFATFEGANAVLLQLAAKGLLSEFRDEMGDLRFWGIMRYVSDRAQVRFSEMNPVVTRRSDPEHLRDPEFQTAAFRYREERLMSSAARRLKSLIDDGMDTFDAMNATQDHLITLARAHVDRLVLECMHDAVGRAPSPGTSEILRSLSDLYALSTIECSRAWYLEAGYMEAPKTRAVRTEVNRLCGELREHAVFLVDAFGIPDDVLRAPIGLAR
jgi:acyl-CoA oxidase